MKKHIRPYNQNTEAIFFQFFRISSKKKFFNTPEVVQRCFEPMSVVAAQSPLIFIAQQRRLNYFSNVLIC